MVPAFAPSGLTRAAERVPSDGTSQTSLVSPFVASTRVITVNATHAPSGESAGAPTVLIR